MALPVPWSVCHGAATIPRAPKGERQPAHIRGERGGAALAPPRARVQHERFHYRVHTAYDTGTVPVTPTRYTACLRAHAALPAQVQGPAPQLRRLPDWTRASALTRPCLPWLFSLHRGYGIGIARLRVCDEEQPARHASAGLGVFRSTRFSNRCPHHAP